MNHKNTKCSNAKRVSYLPLMPDVLHLMIPFVNSAKRADILLLSAPVACHGKM